jgi:hypothetical protein
MLTFSLGLNSLCRWIVMLVAWGPKSPLGASRQVSFQKHRSSTYSEPVSCVSQSAQREGRTIRLTQTFPALLLGGQQGPSSRKLRELTLATPIRYGAGDPVERWLHELLCLDASIASHRLIGPFPPAANCQLYQVDRDTLFSYHKVSGCTTRSSDGWPTRFRTYHKVRGFR